MKKQLDDNIQQLWSEHADDRAAGMDWLLAHPDLAHDRLVEIARLEYINVATPAAFELLVRIGRPADVPILAARMSRGGDSLIWDAAMALAKHPALEAERALAAALGNTDADVVSAALVALGVRGMQAARGDIEATLEHENSGVRYRAVLTLERLGVAPSLPALHKRLEVEEYADVSEALREVVEAVEE